MLLCAFAVGMTTPGTAFAGDPGPDWLAGASLANRNLQARMGRPAIERPAMALRAGMRAALDASGRLPWDDYYAQRASRFTGDATVDIVTGQVTATVTADLTISGTGHQQLYFLMSLTTTSVKDGDGNDVPFDTKYESGYALTHVTFPAELEDGQPLTLTFQVSGTPDCTAAGPLSVEVCHFNDKIAYLMMEDTFLPMSIAGDFATLDLNVTIAKGNVIASSGTTIAITPGPDADHETHRIVQDFPSDSHSMGIAPYLVSQLPWGPSWGQVWLRTFTLDDALIESVLAPVLNDIVAILTYDSDRYGPFIFPKMETCQITNDAGAAFGQPALLWIPDMMWLTGAGGGPATGTEASDQRTALFAHELAHQWYGDAFKTGDGYAPWLNEGFAEYSSISYMANLRGDDYARGMYDQYSMYYTYYLDRTKDFPLSSNSQPNVSDSWTYQVVTYFKGAAVAHTLERVIGLDKLLGAYQSLYNDIAGKDAYYDTTTLKQYLEKSYGQGLDWFFDEWVYGRGYPIYTVTSTRAKGGAGQEQAQVRVQRAANFTDVTFTMPVHLTIVTANGATDHLETIDQDDMTFTYDLDGRFVKTRFDPDGTFIRRVIPGFAGDVDLSGEIDGIDLLYAAWAHGGILGSTWNFLPWVDFNGDAMIDELDESLVTDNFGKITDGTGGAP